LSHSVRSLKNEKARFKVALIIQINTQCFNSADEFFTCPEGPQYVTQSIYNVLTLIILCTLHTLGFEPCQENVRIPLPYIYIYIYIYI
jgi:hypothetical protein